jgi:hypothetical protein
MFPCGLERAQSIQRVFQRLFLFAGAAIIEKLPPASENRKLRFRDLLWDGVPVSFENGGSVEGLPMSLLGAWGKCRVHELTPKGMYYTSLVLISAKVK